MPYKPKSPCRYAGCNLLSIKNGYCEEHLKLVAHEYERYRRDPETHKRYGSEWRKVRAAYIAAHPLCEMCLADGRYVPANVVHHKKELSDGGTHDSSNLQSLCVQCHNSVTMTTTNEKRRRG
jgi:5-methylcytosine-specific restriction protein A